MSTAEIHVTKSVHGCRYWNLHFGHVAGVGIERLDLATEGSGQGFQVSLRFELVPLPQGPIVVFLDSLSRLPWG